MINATTVATGGRHDGVFPAGLIPGPYRAQIVPAALGEESYTVPTQETGSLPSADLDMEFVVSDLDLSLTDSDVADPSGHWGSEAQALLRRYVPQFYAPGTGEDTKPPTQASLLFRDRRDSDADIPLTQDFIQEYDRISKEPRLCTPAALRCAFQF